MLPYFLIFFKAKTVATIKISKNNFFHNLKLAEEKTQDKSKLAIVLKDNAYGHGITEIASLASEFGIKNAIVKTLEEALKIEIFFENILILGKVDLTTYSHHFHITINTLDDIHKISQNKNVHIKLDTGMHRNGIMPNQLQEAIYGLFKKNITIKGVFTHHRSADKLSGEYYWQNQNFKLIKRDTKTICEQLKIPIPQFHSMNSAALFRCEKFDEDLARIGIAAYGYIDNDNGLFTPNLKPVMSLWGEKVSTRPLEKNQKVGYGGGFECDKNMIISTYDIGYGDGFLRLNEKDEYFAPNGSRLLGRVSMDNTSFDCSDESICIFDDARKLAKIHNTITYEITTSLNNNIKREII